MHLQLIYWIGPCWLVSFCHAERPDPVELSLLNRATTSAHFGWMVRFEGNPPLTAFNVTLSSLTGGKETWRLPNDTLVFNATGLRPGTTYRIRIVAENKIGQSDPETENWETEETGRRPWGPDFPGGWGVGGGGGGGGVLILGLGGSVPPSPENPYPISDQNIRFFGAALTYMAYIWEYGSPPPPPPGLISSDYEFLFFFLQEWLFWY